MHSDTLTLAVGALYAICVALIVATAVRGSLRARRARVHERRVDALRGPVEACVLEGAPMPRVQPADVEPLLDLVLRYSSMIRGRDVERLTQCLGEQGVVDDLGRRLKARRAWQRADAAETLGRLRVQSAVPALIVALADPSEDVRTVAARSLAAIRDPRAVPALARTLADPSRWTLSLVAENLMAMGPAVVPSLLDLLESKEHNVRVAAVQILGEVRDPKATPPLLEMLGDENLNLRTQVAAALGKLGGAEAERALLSALKDPEWQVRAQAAKSLGRLGRPAAAAPIARTMPDDNWWVRVNCAEALARLGAPGRRQLERLTRHKDRYVRDQAVAALEMYGLKAAG